VTRRLAWCATALVLGVNLSGCSSLGPDDEAAGEAAVAFHEAQRRGDGGSACDLLIETTRTDLEQSTDQPCETAILAESLPSAEQVVDVAAYGRNARVILDGDVVFLSVAEGRWQVSAAGCVFQANAPYDCSLSGS